MNIIITGASGLIGSNLTKLLKQNHFSVTKLTTNPKLVNDKDTFLWHPDKGYIDIRCFKEENIIINLAGANIFDKRWTDQRKKELADSRIEGTSLLFDMINKEGFNVKRLINASAIGIYPDPCGPSVNEDQPHGDSFISDLCIKWEAAAHLFDAANIPVTIIRIGIVLDAEKGFLEALAKPIKMNAGAVLGTGK
ncbi:MAG: NAD-dependent epimerase/dehydratase family protein, partial [Bacteroidia bacterium]|nr:NAD-dependent epimerase/dehydratase family protein [Bacteroidia bacterium]